MAKTSDPPPKGSIGRRQLAAILFTDVVGFSGLVEKNEKLTLLLVQRDLKLISDVCHQFDGEVLKNTGDGCLATFGSVESAVRSALKIQGIFTEAAHRLAPEKILHHRIGIHLGDVFLGQGDVLGNGVNIAARLLGEAEPDGICISQAVYDVVKHRLGVKAVCIGARELKNIRDAVPVYRLLLGAAAQEAGHLDYATPAARPVVFSSRPILYALSLVLIVSIGLLLFWIIGSHDTSLPPVRDASVVKSVPTGATQRALAIAAPTTAPPTSQPPSIMQRPPDYVADSAAAWETFPKVENSVAHYRVEKDRYVMEVGAESGGFHMAASPWGSFGDVTVEVTARMEGQPYSWWAIALASAQNPRRFARVSVTGNGQVRLDFNRLYPSTDPTTRNARPEGIQTFSEAANPIRRGGVNTIVLHVRDRKMTVFVNGQPLPAAPSDISPLGPIVVQPSVGGVNGGRADFERLRVLDSAPNRAMSRDSTPLPSTW